MNQKLDKLLRAHPPLRFIVDAADVYFSKHVGRAAAELAYFLILTFFPIVICVSAFLNELDLDLTYLLDQAGPFLPESESRFRGRGPSSFSVPCPAVTLRSGLDAKVLSRSTSQNVRRGFTPSGRFAPLPS